MAKLTRVYQKLFGATGSNGDFGIFGSLAAGNPTFSKDPEDIQSLDAWNKGWADETISDNRPALEDMNALCYLMFYQLCYVLQQGVAEWDAETTYYTNSMVQYSGNLYISLLDNNINNTPDTAGSYWSSFGQDAVGTIKMWPTASAPGGTLICNGDAVSRTTYASLFSVVGTTFGAGNGSTTFNLPDYRSKVPVGYDGSNSNFNAIGKTGGEETHTLSTSETPSHTHTVAVNTAGTPGTATPGAGTSSSFSSITSGATGGGAAHNNLQPYNTINFIIKY